MLTKTSLPNVPAALESVALVDASTAAAAGGMSVSWWHAEVAAGRAPTAAIQRPRCTRWRLADVVAFWIAFAADGAADVKTGERMTAHAKRASAAAQAKRTKAKPAGAVTQ